MVGWQSELDEAPSRCRGDTREIHGRYTGDLEEMVGWQSELDEAPSRCRGDTREIHG
jgi:hypothetical protein